MRANLPMPAGLFGLLLVAGLSLVPTGGLAHSGGSTELLAQLVIHPRDPNVMVARYEAGSDGLLYSDDGGQSFRMLCASAISDAADKGSNIAITGDGSVLLGSFAGVLEDDGAGCQWIAVADVSELWVRHMARHPADPDVMFAVTGTGIEGTQNALAMRDADGAWSDVGARGPLLLTGVAATTTVDGATRLYTSAEGDAVEAMIDGAMQTIRACTIRMSDDLGETWTQQPCPLTTGKIRVEVVDPGDPDRIVVSEHNENAGDIAWVSDDHGETWRVWAELSDFGAIAFDGEGRAWLGDWGDAGSPVAPRGLLRADSLEATPEVVADYPVHCLAYAPATDTLHACQRFWVGTIDPQSGEFTTTFSLDETFDFVQCEGVDTAGDCEGELCGAFCGPGSFPVAEVCEAYDGPTCGPCAIGMAELRPAECDGAGATATPDAGTTADAGVDETAPSDDGGCGCRLARRAPLSGPWALLAIAAATLRLRRLRRRPARH